MIFFTTCTTEERQSHHNVNNVSDNAGDSWQLSHLGTHVGADSFVNVYECKKYYNKISYEYFSIH